MNNKVKNINICNLTNDFENLYNNSKNGDNNYNFMSLIVDERNIRLAYRELLSKRGSKTFGVDGKTISDIKKLSVEDCVFIVENRLKNYTPKGIRKMYVLKEDGSKRLIGIPTLEDRLIQQCIKQVLEPWCEARFYNHSYGFRPLRDQSHALSRVVSLINRGKCYYVVKFDIESFFETVDHKFLIEKLWNFGVRDKRLISIIKSMIKSESNKGLLQGCILSPLLANVYLTDLDRWVETQWEHYPYDGNIHTFHNKKDINLKHGYIVRYGDDFLIMTKEYKFALLWKKSITDYLDKRLHLSTNKSKCKIVNLKQKYVDFLGFKIKVMKKGKTKNGYVAETHISDRALKHIQNELHKKIEKIQYNSYTDRTSIEYNLTVMGFKNYFKYATMVYLDLDKIGRGINKSMKIRLKDKSKIVKFCELDDFYKSSNVGIRNYTKVYKINNTPLHIINAVHHKNPMNYRQNMNIYTKKGRSFIKDTNELNLNQISLLVSELLVKSNKYSRDSVELADNRIILYLNKKGKSYITHKVVNIEDYNCHHKIPVSLGGTNEYINLVLLSKDEHILVHATDEEIINKYIKFLNLSKSEIKRINHLRSFLKLFDITV